MFNKSNIAIAIGAAFLFGSTGTASAANTTASTGPLNQAISSVDKNLDKNPENPGLRTAAQRLERNKERLDAKERETEKTERHERHHTRIEKTERHARIEKVERAEKIERPEKAERPEKVERPEVERPEKVERPEVERPEKAERPES